MPEKPPVFDDASRDETSHVDFDPDEYDGFLQSACCSALIRVLLALIFIGMGAGALIYSFEKSNQLIINP